MQSLSAGREVEMVQIERGCCADGRGRSRWRTECEVPLRGCLELSSTLSGSDFVRVWCPLGANETDAAGKNGEDCCCCLELYELSSKTEGRVPVEKESERGLSVDGE